jgi:hypothetical protein
MEAYLNGKNEGNSLTNNEGQTTNEVHAFSKKCGEIFKKE